MPNHVKSLDIHNFKGIKDLNIKDMKSINIFVGDNNTGKTTILEVMNLFERPFDYVSHLKVLSRKYNQRVKYNLIKEMFNECDLNNTISIDINLNNKQMNLDIKGEEEEIIYFDVDEDYIGEDEPVNRMVLSYKFEDEVNTYHIDSTKKNAVKIPKERIDFLNIGYAMPIDTYMEKSTLEAIDTVIKKGEKQKLIDLLKLFDENIIDLNYISNKEIYLTTKDKSVLSISNFGDGLKKAIVLIAKAIDAQDGVLLIDEIETGIHKDILGKIFRELIKNTKEYNTQIITTTHSKEAIESILENLENNLDEVAIYRLENFRGKLYARRFSGEDAYEVIIQEGGDLR
ncbi:MAG: AAA family ATPase [Peptostreptococcaceae bacterium]